MLTFILFIVGFFIGFFGTSAYYRSQIRQHYIYIDSVNELNDAVKADKKYSPEEQLLYAKMLNANNKQFKRKEF